MGLTPCTATITTPNATIETSFSPVTNSFSITITPQLRLVEFCIDIPCVSSSDFTCTGDNCGACNFISFEGIGATPIDHQPGTTKTYTFIFNSNLTFNIGTVNADFTYRIASEEVQLQCGPVCAS